MVNVQMSAQLLFGFAAPLAGVVIAAACIAALTRPVRAVVGQVTAFPAVMLVTGQVQLFARLATKLSTVALYPRRVNLKYLAALLAGAFDLWFVVGVHRAAHILGLPFAKACLGAKVVRHLFDLRFGLFKTIAALVASNAYLSLLLQAESFRPASEGAIFARPRKLIRKLLAALRTGLYRLAVLTVRQPASHRAKAAGGIGRWVVAKRLAALFAVSCRNRHLVSFGV